jgi:hypothetical protein
VRNNTIAALDHLARRFGKARFVTVDQRQAPCASNVKKEAANKKQRVIDTDLRRVLAIYRSCSFQVQTQNNVRQLGRELYL